MSDEQTSRVSAIEEHAAAAVAEVRQALGEITSLLAPREHSIAGDVVAPLERVVQGWARFAEVAVGPLAEFVDRERELAEQMAAWAQLQHELADRMAAWADMQRQLANGMAMWLAPVGGATHMTTRLLHELAGEQDDSSTAPADVPKPRAKRTPSQPKRRSSSSPKS